MVGLLLNHPSPPNALHMVANSAGLVLPALEAHTSSTGGAPVLVHGSLYRYMAFHVVPAEVSKKKRCQILHLKCQVLARLKCQVLHSKCQVLTILKYQVLSFSKCQVLFRKVPENVLLCSFGDFENLSSAGAVALGGRKGRDRASIEATVAVATLSYGSSGSVCAHACVLCVLSCVWLGNRVENSNLCRNLRRRARGKCL